MLNAPSQHSPLALFLAVWQKYTSGAAMESAIRPPPHKTAQVCDRGDIAGVRGDAGVPRLLPLARPAVCRW